MHLPIRLIPHGKVKPCLLIHNTLIMRKGIKSGFSVISAHAAFTKSAEAHFRSSQMNDCVVDTAAAETAAGSNFFCRRFVGSKKVKCQWMRHGVDPVNHFFQTVKYKDRHNRAEDLFLHNRIRKGDIIQNGRFDAESFPVGVSSVDSFPFFNQSQNPVKMFFIYDFPIVRIMKGRPAVLYLF